MQELVAQAGVLALALVLDGLVGDPPALWRKWRHPVVWAGALINATERRLNRQGWPGWWRRLAGAASIAVLLWLAALAGVVLAGMLRLVPGGFWLEIVVVAVLLAQRALYDHVAAVAHALRAGDLTAARQAVRHLVSRDVSRLDAAGVSRAAIESCAENFSDGVIAPAFWYLLAGLPGLFAYKMLNTADSMIGYRNARYRDFGWAAARLDDAANFLPARLAALFLLWAARLLGGARRVGLRQVAEQAAKHRSPNAGWPEAAMAGALGVALCGPRQQGGRSVAGHWLFADARRDLGAGDIAAALRLFVTACVLHFALVAAPFVGAQMIALSLP